MDHDLALMRTKVEQLIETSSTSDQLLSQSLEKEIVKPITNTTNEFKCDGTDCKMWHIVLIIILVAVIPFIFAYFYIKSHGRHKL